jgi:hypothetical protein
MHANCRQAISKHILQLSNEGQNKELHKCKSSVIPMHIYIYIYIYIHTHTHTYIYMFIRGTNCGLMFYLLKYSAVHVTGAVAMLQFFNKIGKLPKY